MAGNQDITSLSEIMPHKTSWTIQTKIVHSWRNVPAYGGESLDMILADADGTLIHAAIKKQQIKKFFKFVKTGEWKLIENFTLSKSIGKYRSTSHAYKLGFMNNTTFRSCPSISNDWYFDFANFQDITNDEGLDENIFIDVLGQVVNFGEIKIHEIKNKPTKKLEIQLRDTSDERLSCTLWEKYADAMFKACQNAGDQRVICLLRFVKINSFNGERSIANAYDGSLLEINPDYPEVHDFVANLPNDHLALTPLATKPKDSKVWQKKEYFDGFPRKTIAELGEAIEVGKCKIMCTINTIDIEFPWYYFQCLKCNKTAHLVPKKENAVVKKGSKPLFNCQHCNEDTSKVVPRYRVTVGVMDNLGDTTKCMLFDNNAFQIIGISATDLLEGNWTEIQDPTKVPQPLQALVGKTFQFLVNIEKSNLNDDYDTYKVSYVWLGNDVDHVDNIEDSDVQVSYSTNEKDQVALTNSSEMSDSLDVASTTPSSKRSKSNGSDYPSEQSSSSKKPCVSSIKGVIEKEEEGREKKEIKDDSGNEVIEDEKNKVKSG